MSNSDATQGVIASSPKAVLRDAVPSDADAYVQWWTRGEWLGYDAPWEGGAKTFDADERVQAFKQGFLKRYVKDLASPRAKAIVATPAGAAVGWVNRYAEKRFPQAVSVGIDICDDAYLNQGIGTDALRLWVGYLFANTDVHRVGLGTYSFNPRMIRVAEKVGFRREGADREIVQWRGQWLDRVRFGLLRREWDRRVLTRPSSGIRGGNS